MKRFLAFLFIFIICRGVAPAQSDSIEIAPLYLGEADEMQSPDLRGESEPIILLGPRVFVQFHDYPLPQPHPLDTVRELSRIDITPDSLKRVQNPVDYQPPQWLRDTRSSLRWQYNLLYSMMVNDPEYISFLYWDLPEPPELPDIDDSLRGYLSRVSLGDPVVSKEFEVRPDGEKIHWLHTFNFVAQLSQAYLTDNWYQGGNSHLAFRGGFLWDVELNPVYHPDMMFKSTVSYKLAVNSTPDDDYHRYNVSQDLFQYNFKTGFKAYHNWFYSFLAQFKTQFVNSYPANSLDRSASFLSPGDLNLGLGMTYNKENAKKTLKFSASISPISYNLKICLDDKVDRAQFGIKPNHRWVNEIGSNAEVNFVAKFWGNTTYTTRLFIFSDYKSLQGDWENTLNFQFTSVFSTQIYAHLRYDTSADSSISRRWGKLMMKEILSVGVSYNFSTK